MRPVSMIKGVKPFLLVFQATLGTFRLPAKSVFPWAFLYLGCRKYDSSVSLDAVIVFPSGNYWQRLLVLLPRVSKLDLVICFM